MKQTSIIILLSLIIIGCGYVIYKDHFVNVNKMIDIEIENRRIKDSLMTLFNLKQSAYEIKEKQVNVLAAELLESKAVVKQKEQRLAKMEANEKVYLKAKKKELALLSEVKVDSAIRYHFREDPDSIPHQILMEIQRLTYCDSVRLSQDLLIKHHEETARIADSLQASSEQMALYSRQQISLLLLSQDKDVQLISIKTRQNKNLKVENKVLKIGIIGTILYGIARSFH